MTPHETILQMKKMLANLDRWIEKAVAHAEAKKFDANNLVAARLAPDMFPFSRQVQSACDSAKFAAAHLSGNVPPKHPDTESTMSELRARCATVVGYIESLRPADFEQADTRKVTLSYVPDKYYVGSDYLREHAVPNFYFHLNMAYAILRHNGVDVGKRDYLGELPLRDIGT
jgi:uncharacterized protein